MSKVTTLDAGTAQTRSIKQTLEKALLDVDNNDKLISRCNKMMILVLNTEDNEYEFGFINCNMAMSEAVTLAEASKLLFFNEMNLL